MIFHHLMGHSGSVNVASEHTRHALLNRYHPSVRLAPAADLSPEEMSTLERANSARYLHKTFGIGRCLRPESAPARFPLPQLAQGAAPVVCTFFLYGVFQLWVVPADAPDTLLRWFSDDLTSWTSASAPVLAGAASAAGSKIIDLQFHHYDLEAVISLCVADADGNDRCLLFESFADESSQVPCGNWRAMGTISSARISRMRPFNAYAGRT